MKGKIISILILVIILIIFLFFAYSGAPFHKNFLTLAMLNSTAR